jgi:RNA polymerase sigma factor (TIGR02999 family)
MSSSGDVTLLLAAAQRGEQGALDAVFERLYPELRRVARAKMRSTDERLVLDTTSLVHECYLRLLRLGSLQITDRGHFLAYAARSMRSVVIDIAREQQAERRGGGVQHVTLTTSDEQYSASGSELIAVHEALEELGQLDKRLVQVVEMRFFAGLDNAEIAQALGVSTRTVERDWEKARSFLYSVLRNG